MKKNQKNMTNKKNTSTNKMTNKMNRNFESNELSSKSNQNICDKNESNELQ